ncbi:MAG: phage tail family protein [Clostridia bacterium]|nr:phage tail family protein [Clostridiales bacterium]MDU7504491.1 phage tail family protein [Clostridia bacterium]
MMIGFTFNGRHSREFGIYFKSVDRTVIPEKRKKEFEILGRSGTLELPSNEYNKRFIPGLIGVRQTDDFKDLRRQTRDLARWLSGTGLLIFDDEPEKAYEATIYSAVGIEQLEVLPQGNIEIEFECQPFAISVDTNRKLVNISDNKEIIIPNKGNIQTCGTFVIKNTGNKTIENMRITRKVVKD